MKLWAIEGGDPDQPTQVAEFRLEGDAVVVDWGDGYLDIRDRLAGHGISTEGGVVTTADGQRFLDALPAEFEWCSFLYID